jgi:pimeloyl-ACP methyl ester carboxylesterase
MKKRFLVAGASGIIAGAVATRLLTRPRDVIWRDSLAHIYHAEYSWFTRVGGYRLHYQDAGNENAPPIILIHGLISSTLIWSGVFLPLAQAGFRVIALDLPGYGYSDKPADAAYTIGSQASAVLGLMDRLGIRKAMIVGASYGAAVAATIALDHAERVERLVLVGPVSSDEPKKKLLLRVVRIPLIGDLATPLFLGSRWVLRQRMKGMYQRLQKPLNQKMVEARFHVLETANMQRAMIRTVRRWYANRIQREASRIRQPTMLVWGDKDDHIPLSEGYKLRDAIPNSRLVVFRNCGHLPPAEYPAQFVELVAGVFRSPGSGHGTNLTA